MIYFQSLSVETWRKQEDSILVYLAGIIILSYSKYRMFQLPGYLCEESDKLVFSLGLKKND